MLSALLRLSARLPGSLRLPGRPAPDITKGLLTNSSSLSRRTAVRSAVLRKSDHAI